MDLPDCPRCHDEGEVCGSCGWSEDQCECDGDPEFDLDPELCPDCDTEPK